MIKIDENKIMKMANDGQLEDLKLYINECIYNQTKISTSKAKQVKAFQAMAERFYKKMKDFKPGLAGGCIIDNELYLCDGYKAVRAKDSTIPCKMIDNDITPIKINEIFEGEKAIKKLIKIELNSRDITAQSKQYKANIKGLKGMDRQHSLDNKGIFLVENDEITIGFNVEYLEEMAKIFDFENCSIQGSGPLNPIYIHSEDFDGIVLPIRLS